MEEKMDSCGWVLSRDNTPEPVRVSKNGNLVSSLEGMRCFARKGDEEKWPEIFPTEESARLAARAIFDACNHDWCVVSHEERKCILCGLVECIPDL